MTFLILTDAVFTAYLTVVLKCVLYVAVLCLLLIISLTDAETMLIPDGLNVALLACGVFAVFIVPEVAMTSRIIGLFCISLPLLVFSLVVPGSFGGGDMKLMAAAGFLLGWQSAITAAAIGLCIGGAYGIYLLATGRKRTHEHFALGPSLCAGIAVALLFGDAMLF